MRIWLISYDIADAKRRRAVEKSLLACGERIQESVFIAALARRPLAQLQATIADLILPAEDALVWYPVCERCQAACDCAPSLAIGLRAGYWIA